MEQHRKIHEQIIIEHFPMFLNTILVIMNFIAYLTFEEFYNFWRGIEGVNELNENWIYF